MKMHSPKFRDPWIRRPQAVNLMIPIIEEELRLAGIAANRDQIIDRFMSAVPRIAIVRGAEDHPPAFGSNDSAVRSSAQGHSARPRSDVDLLTAEAAAVLSLALPY